MILDFEFFFPKSAEDKEMLSLFMSQDGSDIDFKIEGKVIPAHKWVLLKKSRYFKNLFNSGMVESRQDVIEIKDCGYEVFKGKRRFYCLFLIISYRIFTIYLPRKSGPW